MALIATKPAMRCFADVDTFDPAKDRCAACHFQDACEKQIDEDNVDELEQEDSEDELDGVSRLAGRANPFASAVSGFAPGVTQYHTVTPTAPYSPPSPNLSCEGVSPVVQVPRQEGEEVWGRLAKNVGLGALARALVEASLVAEDERTRPVGQWGRVDRPRKK
jgi:hypothetical protein